MCNHKNRIQLSSFGRLIGVYPARPVPNHRLGLFSNRFWLPLVKEFLRDVAAKSIENLRPFFCCFVNLQIQLERFRNWLQTVG